MNQIQTTATNAVEVAQMIVVNARIALSMAGESDASRLDSEMSINATNGMLKAAKEMADLAIWNGANSDDVERTYAEIKALIKECDFVLEELTGRAA